MNVEANRLETFCEWPANAVVTPARIAKAGFYSVRNDLTVECFACKLRISEWDYGDQIMARHRLLSPSCPFVLDPPTSGNVPIIQQLTNNIPSSSVSSNNLSSCYYDEPVRLRTFENWPITHIVTPASLARAGFYYLKEGDTTKCPYCKGVVRAWEVGDDPDLEHRRHFPSCQFVISTIIPRLNKRKSASQDSSRLKEKFPNLTIVGSENFDELGVHTHKGPKRSEYATVESRLRTFVSWPADLIQTPDILAQAGFYYEGMGDQVRCFHCDGGLRHWDPQDDPWTEHARWFPRCSFVKLVKGQEFVTACSLENNVTSNLEEVIQNTTTATTTTTETNIRPREISERELQEHMTSPTALMALSIGLNVERVKRAIRQKLLHTGRGYTQPDALVEAALNLQHEEEDEMSSELEHSQVPDMLRNVLAAALDSVVEKPSSNAVSDKVSPEPITTESVDNNSPDEKMNGDGSKLNKPLSLEEENRVLREARLCKICMDVEVGIVFLPCGHLATCVNCAPNLEDCPVCRSAIKATVRTFLS